MWRDHAVQTAEVLNEINPDFIRVRTLVINSNMALHDDVEKGSFVRETDEEIVEEEKLLIEHLECQSSFVSDHINNLLPEIEGKLPQDKEKMLAVISRFQALPPEEKANFRVGRRMGLYSYLDDLKDTRRHEIVEQAVYRLKKEGNGVDEENVYKLMEGFI